MLKHLNPILTPDLLWAIAAMGHGDTIAVVDRNYPAHALHTRVITLAGVTVKDAVTAIAGLLPVDQAVSPAVTGMVPDDEPSAVIPSHADVAAALTAAEGRDITVAPVSRSQFYHDAKPAFAAVLTAETSSYACFLITKGVVG